MKLNPCEIELLIQICANCHQLADVQTMGRHSEGHHHLAAYNYTINGRVDSVGPDLTN